MEDSILSVHRIENYMEVKVHVSLCEGLAKVLHAVKGLILAIESSRPGCRTGIQELCSLNSSVDKGTQILRHCAESSKFYLVITSQATVSRCERILAAVIKSLRVIQSMVQEQLACKIESCLGTICNTNFFIESNEEEAGEILLSLLRRADADEESELEAFQLAASRLNLTSSRALLSEKRCIRNLLDKLKREDVKKQRILIYLLSLLEKHGKAVLDSSQDNLTRDINNFSRNGLNRDSHERTITLMEMENGLSGNKYHSAKLLENGIQSHKIVENENQSKPSTVHLPPDEFLCPLSSELMFDPVSIASGETFERIWIEKWLEGNNTCPKTRQKLADLSIVPNSSLKNLISQWCKRHGITVQNPSLQAVLSSSSIPTTLSTSDIPSSSSVPIAFRTSDIPTSSSISSLPYVSSVLLYNKTAQYRFEKAEDMTSISDDASLCSNSATVGGFDNCHLYGKAAQYRLRKGEDTTSISDDASFCSTSATMGDFDMTKGNDQMFAWSAIYRKYKSFESFNCGCFLKFLTDLSDLPQFICNQSLEDVKLLIRSDCDTLAVMLSNGFKEALIEFVGYAFESCNIRAQKTGLELLQALLSSTRNDLPALDNDASFLLTWFLRSGLNLESLSIICTMCRYVDCIPSIVDSGVTSSILKIIDSGNVEFLELAVEILSHLSYIPDIRSQILLRGRLAKLAPLLGEKKFANSCLKILLDLCNAAERAAVAETDGCIALIAELLEIGTRDEQADAVAILLSLCGGVPDYSWLVMREGVIPSLVSISVNGSRRGKELSQKLLQLLRDLRPGENLRCASPIIEGNQCQQPPPLLPPPLLPPRSPISLRKSPAARQNNASKLYGFFGRKMMFFSKSKSVPPV